YSLFNNVIEDVRAIPNINLSLYLSWVEKVSRGLSSLNLVKTNNVASVLGAHYTGVEKKSLEFCEHELKRVKSKPVFSEKNQKELFKQASILQKNVIDSNDLDPQIKTFIFNKLEDILNAITYYDFTGDEGIINATERAVGACVIHPEFKNSENRNTNCGELIKLLAKTMTIIVTADGFYKISAKVVANLLN
ncbi:MAG: hypothetical protein KOO69_08190, partial [Victivallales bacterium]|nr:hypothetical protein [Victivallales bacterium]